MRFGVLVRFGLSTDPIKTEYGDLGGHMHHLAHSMTKLCQGREQDNAGWEGIPVYDSSGGKAVFIYWDNQFSPT